MQLKSTRVEHQVFGHRDRRVVEGEGVRSTVVVSTQVVAVGGSTRVVGVGGQLVTVQGWVVKEDWSRLQEQVKVRAPGVSTAGVPAARQRCVGIVVGVGLVLTRRTEGTNDVVFVRRTVAVFNHDPNAGVSISVRDVATDLEQLGHGAVKQRGGDDVVCLVDTSRWRLSVNGHVGQATEVNHRRVGTRRGHIVGTVAGVSRGVRTIVAVEVNIDQHHVGTTSSLGDFRRTAAHTGARDARFAQRDVGVSAVDDVGRTCAVGDVCTVNRDGVLGRGTGTAALERFHRWAVHGDGPAATGHRDGVNIPVVHLQGFRRDGGPAH